MASPKAAASSSRREEKSRRAASFPGKVPSESREFASAASLSRPRTQPDLFASRRPPEMLAPATEIVHGPPRPTKLLLNVTVLRSLGHIHIIISPESTVEDLIVAVLRQYTMEGRRPALPCSDASAFGLHYSQFSLERLEPKESLINLGSRNFFLCPKPSAAAAISCSGEAEKTAKMGHSPNWFKFINFLR